MKKILFGLISLATLATSASLTLPTAFTAGFTQTITSPSNKTIRYSGGVQYNSPSLLKWSYNAPTKKEVCTDGRLVLVVDHNLEQVSMFEIKKGFNLPAVIKSAKAIKSGEYLANYDKQKFHIKTTSDNKLERISYIDELDNSVMINFNNTNYLQTPIKNTNLKCNYSSSYDIIEG